MTEAADEPNYEKPKGKLLLYWGCGVTVRPGQPKVLDMASASAADLAAFFVSRRATQRGAHSATGRPVWPNAVDARMVPDAASLVGEHAFSGEGVPEGFRFQVPPAQDLMPPLQLQYADQGGAGELRWNTLPTARAHFAAGMGARRQDEMVIWTSSELPDTGFGLIDYQTNAARRPLVAREGAAGADDHAMRRAQGRLAWRGRDAARHRVRQRVEPGLPAAARRPEGPLGAGVGREAAPEVGGHGDPGHARHGSADRLRLPRNSGQRKARTRPMRCPSRWTS